MNKHCACLFAGIGFLIPVLALAEDEPAPKGRLSFSPRVGFNVTASFEGAGGGGAAPRMTPNGDAYNYDDGYVLTDISGNQGGQTWYWGYDDSSAQVSGSSIVMSSSTISDGEASFSDHAEPSIGGELIYNMDLGSRGPLRFGFEGAVGYQNIRVNSSGNFMATLTTTTDTYGFTSGSMPPTATPSSPYQGTYEGPGFLINDSPSSSVSADTAVAVSSDNELRADLWAARFGPYFEYPVNERLLFGLSGGVEAVYVHATTSWSEAGVGYSSRGEVDDSDVLAGFYVAGTVAWRFADHWSLAGGVQYHNMGVYKDSHRDRSVELDMSNSIFTTLGVVWSF